MPEDSVTTTFRTIAIERRPEDVAWVIMSRPDVFNAFDEDMIAELDRAFQTLAADERTRVIVLAGAGKHFSAGADLAWMKRASTATEDWNLEDARRFAALLATLETCPKPTLARVQGAALGGGVGLACACDIVIAADTARFAVSEAKFGILPAVIGPALVNAVGPRQARRLALSTTPVDAGEALALGLAHKVVPASDLDAAIAAQIADLLIGGPLAQREIKRLYGQLTVGPVSAATRDLTARTIARVRGTDEAGEGFDAFLEKRPARWRTP
jgi:methylglutaconyl-CoA hydratase